MNMREIEFSIPDLLQVLLFPVIVDYISKVSEKINDITVTAAVKNIPYKDEIASTFRDYKKKLRNDIYSALISKKVIRKYPQISQVIKLKYPNYQKCIIILSGLDIKIDEICDVLQAAEDSISSQRSKRKNDIERIFGRKPWMKGDL